MRALGVLVEQQGHFLGLAASQQSIHVHTIASLFSRPSVPTLEGANQEVGGSQRVTSYRPALNSDPFRLLVLRHLPAAPICCFWREGRRNPGDILVRCWQRMWKIISFVRPTRFFDSALFRLQSVDFL